MGIDAHRSGLDEQLINAGLTPYWRVSVIKETSSTQSDLVKFVNTGKAQSGEVLIAEFQSAGRGRLDRSFIAPPNTALLFSIYLENEIDLSWLPLIAGIAVCDGLKELTNAKLKWPNDILISNKKCGGILAEKIPTGVIIGIGLNVNQTQEELPIPEATSLAINGIEVNRNNLLISILHEFGRIIRHWPMNRVEIKAQYEQLCETIGHEVEVTSPSGEITRGLASGINQNGELLVGSKSINVGDVRHLR